MSFFKDLLGKRSANSAQQLGQRSMDRVGQGYNQADNYARQGYDTASARYQPYAAGGQAGYTAYQNALGLNGSGAQQTQFGQFQASPFLAYARQNSGNENNRIFGRYGANGMANSGASMLAVSRAAGERAQSDVTDYLNRLQATGQQGLQVAGAQAGLDSNYYGGMADRSVGRQMAINGIDANATQAASNARMQGTQNLLGAIGGAAQLAMGMPPTSWGGMGKGQTSPGGVPPGGSWGGSGGGWQNPDYAPTNYLGGGYAADPRRPWA